MEYWKDIKGYEGIYQVSNMGRVRSVDRYVYNRRYNCFKLLKGSIMSLHLRCKKNRIDRKDYSVGLNKDGKKKTFSVARLTAIAFIPNPDNLPQVNHKDENPLNNFVWVNPDGSVDPDKSNLEWCTVGYNINYGTRNERVSIAMRMNKNNHGYMCTVLQYTKKGEFVSEYPTTEDASRQTGINAGNIWQAINGVGRRKSAGGFVWKYKNIA